MTARQELRRLVERVRQQLALDGEPPEVAQVQRPAVPSSPSGMAPLIDHTALSPGVTEADVRRLCREVERYGFGAACVNPCYVALAAELLAGSSARVCTVAGFPLGAALSSVKVLEARKAVAAGASEVDMVMNVGLLKSARYRRVLSDLQAVVEGAKESAVGETPLVKVIIEAALLTEEEKVAACLLARHAGADFVKTSTGFADGGADVDDVMLMREVVGEAMGVKAAGGIRTFEQARVMVARGADRIGASSSVAIVGRGEARGGNY